MSKESTQEQKKVETDTHDVLIKHIFDNLRNIIICATFAVAGAAVVKHSATLALGAMVNIVLGSLVVISAVVLLGWNMIYGARKTISLIKGKKSVWLLLPFVMLYMFAVLAVFHAWSRVEVQQIFRTAPNTGVESDAPQAAHSSPKILGSMLSTFLPGETADEITSYS
jgi:hypothetical protein